MLEGATIGAAGLYGLPLIVEPKKTYVDFGKNFRKNNWIECSYSGKEFFAKSVTVWIGDQKYMIEPNSVLYSQAVIKVNK